MHPAKSSIILPRHIFPWMQRIVLCYRFSVSKLGVAQLGVAQLGVAHFVLLRLCIEACISTAWAQQQAQNVPRVNCRFQPTLQAMGNRGKSLPINPYDDATLRHRPSLP